ncbi:MAG: lasso peptide biosynthesis B2 protein [Arenicellales bacterium]
MEWRLLFIAMVLLPITGLSIYLLGFNRTRRLLNRGLPVQVDRQPSKIDSLEESRTVARMVSVAARFGLYRANCLKQSLVLCRLLQHRGFDTELHIGVNKSDTFSAHAWVELNGNLLIDNMTIRERYVRLL